MDVKRQEESPRKPVELLERLKRHPILQARVESLLDLVENVKDVRRADEAERQAVEALRHFGQELLSEWAQDRARQAEADVAVPERVKHSKKKSTGTARSDRCG